jgi:DNA-binding HxlR family transcriptional regulator
LVSLTQIKKRFKEITEDIKGLSDKTLSKELKDLEMNQLVKRTLYDAFPPNVEYSLTEDAVTINNVMEVLREWGVIGRCYPKIDKLLLIKKKAYCSIY